jgi:hypothetical protein
MPFRQANQAVIGSGHLPASSGDRLAPEVHRAGVAFRSIPASVYRNLRRLGPLLKRLSLRLGAHLPL